MFVGGGTRKLAVKHRRRPSPRWRIELLVIGVMHCLAAITTADILYVANSDGKLQRLETNKQPTAFLITASGPTDVEAQIAVDSHGSIYAVSGSLTHYSSTGQSLGTTAIPGAYGLAISSGDALYVSKSKDNGGDGTVIRRNATQNSSFSLFATLNSGTSGFVRRNQIAITPQNTVYVVDDKPGLQYIDVFSSAGNLIGTIEPQPGQPLWFAIKSVATDSMGNVYFASEKIYRVAAGSTAAVSYASGSYDALACDSAGNLYAAVQSAKRIDRISAAFQTTLFADATAGITGPIALAIGNSNGSPSPTPTATANPSPTVTITPTPTPAPTATPSPSPGPKPVIMNVRRKYHGVFLGPTPLENEFYIDVTWSGNVGDVKVTVDGGQPILLSGGPSVTTWTFNMAVVLPPRLTPHTVAFTAKNAEGQESDVWTEQICDLPMPVWVDPVPPGVTYSVVDGEVTTAFTQDVPHDHWAKDEDRFLVPSGAPILGGAKFGLAETFIRSSARVSSVNPLANAGITGQTGFFMGSHQFLGEISGTGDYNLDCSGFTFTGATIGLTISGTVIKEYKLSDVFPKLDSVANYPVIGGALAKVVSLAKVGYSFGPTAQFEFMLDDQLRFKDYTDTMSVAINGQLQVSTKSFSLEASGGGGGKFTIGAPADPFVRAGAVGIQVGLQVTFKGIFYVPDLNVVQAHGFKYTPDDGWQWGTIDPFNTLSTSTTDVGSSAARPAVSLASGKYQQRPGSPIDFSDRATGAGTIMNDVFPDASPFTMGLADGRQLLLWIYADPELPITQATGIMWATRDADGSWSAPKLIASDTRAEFSPVASIDATGKVVAAWLRVKNHASPANVNTLSDVAAFYKDFEVVTAVFDTASGEWTEVTAVTDDSAFDTDLHLSSDRAGNMMLSWLSNPDAEIMSSAASPSTLKVSMRSGAEWSVPVAVGTSLIGVTEHAAAVRGEQAFIVLSHTPEGASMNVLRLLQFANATWTSGPMTSDYAESRQPSIAFDTDGVCHVLWLFGEDLVDATTDAISPRVIRPQSAGLGFYDAQLIEGPDGGLAFLYHAQSGDDAIGSLFQMTYDKATNVWSSGRPILEDTGAVGSVSGFIDSNNSLQLAYVRTDIFRTSTKHRINGDDYLIENIPIDGRSDLRAATISATPLLPARLANISTRMRVGTADNALIGGFIVTGSQPKNVLIRAIGPSLPINDNLPDPILELHDGSGAVVVSTNDNWVDSPKKQAIIDSTIPPSNDFESAIIATLPANNSAYTAVVRGVGDSTGVGLVEVYDLGADADSVLANISTRGSVGRGDDVMIGGFIILGDKPQTVIIRAVGPSLPVDGALEDPTLDLVNADGESLAFNDNWRDNQQTAIEETTIPPSHNLEAAIVATLPPSRYTAVVRGSSEGTGLALVEVYALK